MSAEVKDMAEGSLASGIKDIVSGLFPSWPVLVSTLVAFILTILLLHFLFRKPIKAALDRRRELIAARIDKAKKREEAAKKILDEHQDLIRKGHLEVKQLLGEARLQAEKMGEEYVRQAYQKAEEIKRQARAEIERERAEFERESKKYIVETAVSIAKTILEREIKEVDNEHLFELLLKEEERG